MTEVLLCDVCMLEARATSVDALARLQLAAVRLGLFIVLRNASPELLELIAFMGLADVLVLEPGRQPE